jgi:hypothetical protein
LKIALQLTLDRGNTGAVLSWDMRVITARAIFVDLKRLAFHLEAQPHRRLGSRRPDPKHVDVTIGFCEEFALDDDEEEVVRMRVLQRETVPNEPT